MFEVFTLQPNAKDWPWAMAYAVAKPGERDVAWFSNEPKALAYAAFLNQPD